MSELVTKLSTPLDTKFEVLKMLMNKVQAANYIRDTIEELDWLERVAPELLTRFLKESKYQLHDRIQIHSKPERGQCYKVSFTSALENPRYRVWFGFAETGADDSLSNWYSHTWLYDTQDQVFIEPTPSGRSHYYGFALSAEECLYYKNVFVKDV